jgi:hypothetical protein
VTGSRGYLTSRSSHAARPQRRYAVPRFVCLTSACRQSAHIPGWTGRAARPAAASWSATLPPLADRATAGQLHFELLADMKLETELTTLPASLVMVAICAGVGLDDSPATELLSAFTDDVIALVWLGKSPLA